MVINAGGGGTICWNKKEEHEVRFLPQIVSRYNRVRSPNGTDGEEEEQYRDMQQTDVSCQSVRSG